MQKQNKKISLLWVLGVMWLSVAAVWLMNIQSLSALDTNVTLTISGWTVSIGSATGFNMWTFTVSSAAQNVERQFTGLAEAFFVEDLKWADAGYYTTVSVTALSGANGVIPATNISIRTPSLTTALLTGTANTNVVLPAGFTTYQTFATPITFIKRDSAANAGKIGKYGAYPLLQVAIPAFQAVGSYAGVLTYTLIEN